MSERVPRIVAGIDIRQFKLAPTDGFLLTRIDGKLGAKALSRETGLPDFSVAATLEKLEKLGVIELIDPNAPPPPPPPPAAPRSAHGTFDAGLLAPKYALEELDEPAELAIEQKKRILDLYYRLEDLDHYTLLGITSHADKKGVKRAYFELAASFHPDRYFKKDLGSFKAKMEVLFNRITEAHDTLTDAAKRAEYDGYLAEVATTRGMEVMLERAMYESAQAAQQVVVAAVPSSLPPQPSLPPSSVPGVPSAAPPSHHPSIPAGPTPEEIRSRKEALARRLMGGQRPAHAATPPKPPSEKPNPLRYSSTADAVDALKRRYEERIENATQQHALRYIQAAEDALAKNDLVAASTSFNVATKFAPDDAALAMRAAEVKTSADKFLAESYQKQATYEERQGHWTEAARSWVKVAKLKKEDSLVLERAANAVWRSAEGDLREAAELAKRAITLAPDHIDNHITLVEVYIKAGLTTSARRAAEAASQLDPKNATIQGLLKRIQKG